MAKVDPYALNMSLGKQFTQSFKGTGKLGIPCPLKNYGKPCGVCERAKRLFSTGDPRDEALAKKIYHKKQVYINVEFLKKRGTTYLLGLPTKCAEMLLDNMYGAGNWGNVAHPVNGLPLVLKKYKGSDGNTNYALSPKIAAEDSEKRVSSKKILASAYSFKTVVADLQAGKIDNFFLPRSDMDIGQSVVFKLLPNVEDPAQPPLFIGYYHYNVTEADIKNVASGTSPETDDFGSAEMMNTADTTPASVSPTSDASIMDSDVGNSDVLNDDELDLDLDLDTEDKAVDDLDDDILI